MITIDLFFDKTLSWFLNEEAPTVRTEQFDVPRSAADLIHSCNVPHVELEALIYNGEVIGKQELIDTDGKLEAFGDLSGAPSSLSDDHSLRPEFPGKPRFVVDVHLGALARLLRLAGFDTIYENDLTDEAILARAVEDQRIVLTRDLGILKQTRLTFGYHPRSTDKQEQFAEVRDRYQLPDHAAPFSHCLKCNGAIEQVPKSEVADEVPEGVADRFDIYHRCTGCGQIFWMGSHFERMIDQLESLGISCQSLSFLPQNN